MHVNHIIHPRCKRVNAIAAEKSRGVHIPGETLTEEGTQLKCSPHYVSAYLAGFCGSSCILFLKFFFAVLPQTVQWRARPVRYPSLQRQFPTEVAVRSFPLVCFTYLWLHAYRVAAATHLRNTHHRRLSYAVSFQSVAKPTRERVSQNICAAHPCPGSFPCNLLHFELRKIHPRALDWNARRRVFRV